MWIRYAAAMMGSVLTTSALGQSLNIDLGIASGGPSASFAAAGEAGVWNSIESTDGESIGQPGEAWLLGLDGQSTQARLVVPQINPQTIDDTSTDGDDQSLMDDYLPGPVTLEFHDLQPGHYRVMTYAWTPGSPENMTAVSVAGLLNSIQVGGVWPGASAEGVTHSLHTVHVLDGDLNIAIHEVDPLSLAAINGVQLVLLPQLDGDVNNDGAVNVDDMIIVIMNWTTPGHGCDGIDSACPGDTDGSGAVDIEDLIRVLLDWTV